MLRKIFIAAAVFLICAANVCAAEGGSCGDGVYWDFENGTLKISGTGEMGNYLVYAKGPEENYAYMYYHSQWSAQIQNITRIVVSEGVSTIGANAFAGCKNLKAVELPSTLTIIGARAFADCSALKIVNLPRGVTLIDDWAFMNCSELETVSVPTGAKLGRGVFENCPRLSNLQIASGGKNLVASKNLDAHEYTRWAKPINSYLYVDGENLIRVENINGRLVVEKYSPEFELIDSRSVDFDFEIWGGFYAGRDANFIITGKSNDAESESAEVIRIAKFDKNWNYLSDAKIFGANTKNPFVGASVRCAESGGKLYIRTGHEMFRSRDGLNHQANMTITLDEAAMKIENLACNVSNIGTGYVSHSFNQFIIVDANKNVVAFDHGDAFPRGAILIRYGSQIENIALLKFAGAAGDNATGAALGGVAETDSGYVAVYAYDGVGGSPDDFWNVINRRSLYAAFVSKNNFSVGGTQTVKIPLSDENFSAGVPILVPVSKNLGYIFCNEMKFNGKHFETGGKIFIARYDSGGVEVVGNFEGGLSDCQPVIYNGRIVWYVTENSAPEFYIFDGKNLIRK